MVIANAYFGDKHFSNVKLSPPIEKSGDNIVTDTDKLDKLLVKSQSVNTEAIGVYDWEEGVLTLFKNGRYTGRVWVTNKQINGNWEYF